ncbi:MAG: hypothetical protein K2H85_11475, partial [Allobaculum sp.]|nr:hypothetical protein [Allobaculum sp.]
YHLGELYNKGEHKLHWPNPLLSLQRKTALALQAYLESHPVQFIICTHPYPGFMLTWLKNHGYSIPYSIMVPTDYTCIPFEVDVMTDWMTLPSSDLMEAFQKEGIESSRLIPTGIPVDPTFTEPCSREEAIHKLGLSLENDYILLAAGSMGAQGMLMILDPLKSVLKKCSTVRILAFCGTNQMLLKEIQKLNHPQIQPIGFTDQMPLYLHAGRVYITKPGGLSITEAAASGIPLVLCHPIPGCETENALFFEKHGWAYFVRDLSTLPSTVENILNRPFSPRVPYDPQFDNTGGKLADWISSAWMLNAFHSKKC